jgi:hypothetical protein
MSIFGKLLKTGLDVVTLPVDVVKDVVTGGGLTTEREEPYTWSKLKRLDNDTEEIRDEIDKL